jgi:hypothetical protein
MVREPFFPFKNRLSQSYSPYSRASIDVKTGYQIRRILLTLSLAAVSRVVA